MKLESGSVIFGISSRERLAEWGEVDVLYNEYNERATVMIV